MSIKLLPLCLASMLFAAAYADPVAIRQITSQLSDRPVSEAANVDVSIDLEGGECSVVCPLPNLTTADSD